MIGIINKTNILYIIIAFCCLSCSSNEKLVKYIYDTNSHKFKGENKLVELKDQIKKRLDDCGFIDYSLTLEGDQIIAFVKMDVSDLDMKSKFERQFKSTRLELWNTYKNTDPEFLQLASEDLHVAQYFYPFNSKKEEVYPHPCTIGYSYTDDVSQMSYRLKKKTKDIENLKLIWSKEESNLDLARKVYNLYMIKTEVDEPALITETAIENISIKTVENNPSNYIINIQFDKKHTSLWTGITKQAVEEGKRHIAIVINDVVHSAPRIDSIIESGECWIKAGYTKKEAEDLAKEIAVGRLRFDLKLLTEIIVKE